MNNTKKKLSTVKELFELAGGSVHVASALNMNQWSVNRWEWRGIPHKMWPQIMKILNVTATELHEMTENAKAGKRAA